MSRLYQLTRRELRDELTLRLPRTEREASPDRYDWADAPIVNAVLDAPATDAGLDAARVRFAEIAVIVTCVLAAVAVAVMAKFDMLPNGVVTP